MVYKQGILSLIDYKAAYLRLIIKSLQLIMNEISIALRLVIISDEDPQPLQSQPKSWARSLCDFELKIMLFQFQFSLFI